MSRTMFSAGIALLMSVALLASACNNAGGSRSGDEPLGASEEEALPPPEDIVDGVGTIQRIELEGGFYGLVADDSTRYNPQNLDEAYQEDGLRVRFRGVMKKDAMTMQMWGTPVEILDIMRLDRP